ncbi:MAG: hypothetical protein HFG12_07950 [Oscillibacter sp.]|jgi:hypothetical protein|uniref:hypothetical protein n=1 Tax=uncultured Oscillibacter sp. TaxID=876091 RepID=UPI00216C8256|nr:hypothetical protein [uncultured Oscillibacter sp.]MCI8813153.1 hypothetical protein [Oscillibacter sp.]MCX4373083.1 hypothetical protein [Dysosmobacter sp.]
MTLVAWEWRKLVRLPALWGFLVLCLAFNGLLLWEEDSLRQPFNEASAIAEVLGQRVDGTFLDGLERLPRTEYGDLVLSAAREMTDIFEDYDTRDLAGLYEGVVKDSPAAVRLMSWKYTLLAERAAHLSGTGAAMDLYAGPVTHDAHQFLYDTLFRAVVTESLLVGMLSMLYLLGFEGQRRTVSLICASRSGRKLYGKKVLAGLTAAVFLYILLAAVTLGVYFCLWDYGGVWGGSVSSQFNYLTDMLFRRPFLTWGDFTVGGYLAAELTLGALLTADFALLAAVCGLLLRNVYASALVLAVVCFGGVGLTAMLAQMGLWCGYFASLVHPACVWLGIGGWFTELGLSGAAPWQETVSTGLDLLAFGLGTALSLRLFRRKDIVT